MTHLACIQIEDLEQLFRLRSGEVIIDVCIMRAGCSLTQLRVSR